MRRRSAWVLASLLTLAVGAPVHADDGASPAEDRRRELEKKLGIKKRPPSTPPTADEDEDEDEDEDDGTEADPPPEPDPPADGSGEQKSPSTSTKRRVVFSGKVHRLLRSGCKSCHQAGGSASGTKLVLTGNLGDDYRAARGLVKPGKPQASLLLTKAAGKGHLAGATFAEGSKEHRALRQWIEDGARRGGGAKPVPATPPATTTPTEPADPPPGQTKRTKKTKKTKQPKRPQSPERPAEPGTEPETAEPSAEAPAVDPAEASAGQRGPAFTPEVHSLLVGKCKSCHQAGAIAGNGRLALTGDASADHATASALVDAEDPGRSLLLTKAAGVQHGGGPTLPEGSSDLAMLREWIEGGAAGPFDPREPVASEDAGEDATDDPEPTVDAMSSASARPGRGQPGGATSDDALLPTVPLPLGLRINGKFDFSYEHRDWKGHPFQSGRNAFQTYHHFLFLSRVADDPFGINVELLTRAFYEFSARLSSRKHRIDALIKGGKILVPFGGEPVFHRSYGGRSGFDQEILPTIWAEPGLAGSVHARLGPVTLSNDLYVVQGYRLREPDAILNLQNDHSSVDDFRAAVGDRLGVGWGPLSGWYSVQLNRLGHDRLLMMQALDLEFWRMPDVPFVEDLVLGLGGMRADVSGGGPGRDYYHFGSYASIGYYPIDFLYLQYRAGLRTTDNRRGLFFDDRRMDDRDRSSHNLTVMARWRGLYGGIQVFWNLEKANEQDDDYLRLTVGYEF